MFTLPDTDTDTERIGVYYYVKNSVLWSDTDACTNSDVDGYCTQFGTYIGTEKMEFNLFSLFLCIGYQSQGSFLHIIGICIGKGIGLRQCKPIRTESETDAMATVANGISVQCAHHHTIICKPLLLVSASVSFFISVNVPLAMSQTLNVREWTLVVPTCVALEMRRQVVARPETHVAHSTLEGMLVRVNLRETSIHYSTVSALIPLLWLIYIAGLGYRY